MLLAIKAKLNNVAMGITTVDDEFMAYIMLTDGTTVGEWLQPQIEESYRNRAMPPTLASKPIALPPDRSRGHTAPQRPAKPVPWATCRRLPRNIHHDDHPDNGQLGRVCIQIFGPHARRRPP